MAQTNVNDYFSAKKRTFSARPSKKRKLEASETDTNFIAPAEDAFDNKEFDVNNTDIVEKSVGTTVKQVQKPKRSAETRPKSKRVGSRSSVRKQAVVNQPKIQAAFSKVIDSSDINTDDDCSIDRYSGQTTEEITPQWDEYDGPFPKTPKRKIQSNDTLRLFTLTDDKIEGQKNRRKSVAKRSLRLEDAATPQKSEGSETEKTKQQTQRSELAKSFQKKLAQAQLPQEGKVIDPELLKERLAKCGKLETLKSKLAEMNSTLKAVRRIEERKKWVESTTKEEATSSGRLPNVTTLEKKTADVASADGKVAAPAYERYEYLAKEGTPALSLPSKYRRLFEIFQGTETVVSMLHNRHEVITFSKLKAAVQNLTKKNFEEISLGQIKTVYPTAYTFRQEKGFARFANKVSDFQLTVEPNFEGLGKDVAAENSDGKTVMTAGAVVKRRHIFNGSLIKITKAHHADFLSKLNPPLHVPDSKLTRWHPRFPLDLVPDIEVAALPKPPVKEYQTAKEVLEATRGKLPPRMEDAMAKVAAKSENEQPRTSVSSVCQNAISAKPALSSAYKGIPLSLLEKIRAKEAARTQAALMRDPKEEKKTEMIRRLPNLMRSLRTYYVTEKKPALPLESVVQKLADNYATSISSSEVEDHLTLLQELAPKWLQIIQISRGKYIKIDKNMDIVNIINDVNNLIKSRK